MHRFDGSSSYRGQDIMVVDGIDFNDPRIRNDPMLQNTIKAWELKYYSYIFYWIMGVSLVVTLAAGFADFLYVCYSAMFVFVLSSVGLILDTYRGDKVYKVTLDESEFIMEECQKDLRWARKVAAAKACDKNPYIHNRGPH